MKKKAMFALAGITAMLSGCASDQARMSMGERAEEKMLTDNKVGGLYLLKTEFNTYNIRVSSQDSVKVGL